MININYCSFFSLRYFEAPKMYPIAKQYLKWSSFFCLQFYQRYASQRERERDKETERDGETEKNLAKQFTLPSAEAYLKPFPTSM